ncbi:MAG TPA: YraN family protein [Polyangia bacterium]|nr:YraN family protein [Polyangia bacterium]
MSRAAGAEAERRAEQFLTRLGFRILDRNFTCKGGELDLVCDDDGTLVFVEVRARKHGDFGTPEETISATKRRRLVLAARHYLVKLGEERACRFDVVAIEGDEVRHLRDAFRATA